ncbi:MAG: nucleotidyltransferase family protein [Oscillospiraceae bacterium]
MERDQRKLGCVVLAAGSAKRFGANKLAATLGGKSLLQRALEAVPADRFAIVAVVTQYPEAEALARSFGFRAVRNPAPERGLSSSVRLGLDAVGNCDAVLFQVADQPLLRRESVARLVEFYLQQPARIAALSHGGVRGNPCLFPARFFPELLALTGDRGGSVVIRQNPEDVLYLETAAAELIDVDEPAALETLRKDAGEGYAAF